jgi:hypothetical protein
VLACNTHVAFFFQNPALGIFRGAALHRPFQQQALLLDTGSSEVLLIDKRYCDALAPARGQSAYG